MIFDFPIAMVKLIIRLRLLEVRVWFLSKLPRVATIIVWVVCKILKTFPQTLLSQGIAKICRNLMVDRMCQDQKWAKKAGEDARKIAAEMQAISLRK